MKALMILSLQNNVAPQFLSFIGTTDETETIGSILHYFNIVDVCHPRYGTTVMYRERIK